MCSLVLYNAVFGVHRNGQWEITLYKTRNYRKMTTEWSFSYNSFVKFYAIFGSLGSDSVLSESRYKDTILQRNYRKMTMEWSFSYNSFVKFHALFRSIGMDSVIVSHVIKGLFNKEIKGK